VAVTGLWAWYGQALRAGLHRFLRDPWVLTLAFGIALAWALFEVAQGIGQLVAGLLFEISDADEDNVGRLFLSARYTNVLTWDVGGRVVTFGQLVVGLSELAAVVATAAFVYRWRLRDESSREAGSAPAEV
jgi:hypothetical protein